MKITINKPAADVYFKRARFVRFSFEDEAVFVAPHDELSDDSLPVQARQMGGFALEALGGLEERIVKALRPNADRPFYILTPAKDAQQLVAVSERPARHIPLVRIWCDAYDTDAVTDIDLTQITAPELWTLYWRARTITRSPSAGRPSREMLAARGLMETFKRIALDIGAESADLRPLAEAMDLIASFMVGSHGPRATTHDSLSVKKTVWRAEHLDNPLLSEQLDRLMVAARLEVDI
jgi:hypothetical protein